MNDTRITNSRISPQSENAIFQRVARQAAGERIKVCAGYARTDQPRIIASGEGEEDMSELKSNIIIETENRIIDMRDDTGHQAIWSDEYYYDQVITALRTASPRFTEEEREAIKDLINCGEFNKARLLLNSTSYHNTEWEKTCAAIATVRQMLLEDK